jgi:hypothetical protein
MKPQSNTLRRIHITLLLILGFIPTSIAAQTFMMRCDTCDESAALAWVRQFGLPGQTVDVLVHNPSAATAVSWRYRVEMVATGPDCNPLRPDGKTAHQSASTAPSAGCTLEPRVQVRSASDEEMQLVAMYKAAYDFTHGTMKSSITVSVDLIAAGVGPITGNDPMRAADLVNNINVRDRITAPLAQWRDALNNTQLLSDNKLANLWNAVVTSVSVRMFGADGSTLTFKIVSPDGSFVEVRYLQDLTNGKVEDAVDSNGRSVITRDNFSSFGGFS